jgi:hypothetical protein
VIDPQDAALVPRNVRREALNAAEQAVGRVLAVVLSDVVDNVER